MPVGHRRSPRTVSAAQGLPRWTAHDRCPGVRERRDSVTHRGIRPSRAARSPCSSGAAAGPAVCAPSPGHPPGGIDPGLDAGTARRRRGGRRTDDLAAPLLPGLRRARPDHRGAGVRRWSVPRPPAPVGARRAAAAARPPARRHRARRRGVRPAPRRRRRHGVRRGRARLRRAGGSRPVPDDRCDPHGTQAPGRGAPHDDHRGRRGLPGGRDPAGALPPLRARRRGPRRQHRTGAGAVPRPRPRRRPSPLPRQPRRPR